MLASLACDGAPRTAETISVRLGATTSIEDSGLADSLQAGFKQDHPNIRLTWVSGGTGEVLQLARRGDIDVTITHDPAAESAFVAQGHGIDRRELMYNDFVIVGPPDDPAALRGQRDAVRALQTIVEKKASFVSRGDDSGTHRKERMLWRLAQVDSATQNSPWYIEAGVGMGETLRLANSRRAYVMTDRGTFLSLQEQLQLEVLVEGDPRLLNRYTVIRVANAAGLAGADSFARWVTGARGKAMIARYGMQRFGRSLFTPVQ